MKKAIFAIIVIACMAGACTNGQKTAELKSRNDSLQNVIQQRDAVLDEMINSMNIIEEGFRAINEAQGRINLDAVGSETNRAELLQENIAFISNTLAKNKSEIERLQKQLQANHANSKQLKVMLENLQKQLAAKSGEIATLQLALAEKNIHIDELDNAVAQLTKVKEQNESTIQQQEAELNAVWYAIGTKRELKEMKILDGGEVLVNKAANMDYFTKADMRNLGEVKTYAKGAKLLTSHPEGSYTLKRDENKQYVLNITEPKAFWSISRYLVIQVR